MRFPTTDSSRFCGICLNVKPQAEKLCENCLVILNIAPVKQNFATSKVSPN